MTNMDDLFFTQAKEKSIFATDDFERFELHFDDLCSLSIDSHLTYGIKICSLRVQLDSPNMKKSFFSEGTVNHVLESSEFGILLRVIYEDRHYTIWLPSSFGQFRFDKHNRFEVTNESSVSYKWDFEKNISLNLLLIGQVGNTGTITYVVMEDSNEHFIRELGTLDDVEKRLYRKTFWFYAKTPSDIWNYLINGSIYDPLTQKGIDKRFKCQQCAYAWWSYFGFLLKETGKKIYDVMQDEVAYSVLLDMSEEGEWGHGYWSNDIETHSRFHLDGIHLLISQYEKKGELMWLEAAEKGMSFFIKHLVEQLDDGTPWFLHDTMEQSIKRYFDSTLFGKSSGNSLCINTHVQALSVLHRLSLLLPDKKIYDEMFQNGTRALRRVLDYQPAEKIYKILMFLLINYSKRMSAQSITGKLKNAIIYDITPKLYWAVRRWFPRIVHPNGFTERDLSHNFFSDRYHIINIKDFLILYKQVPMPWLRSYIINGVTFIRKFLAEIELEKALSLSTFYIEFIDILYMYDFLIEHVEPEEMNSVEDIIYKHTGGYSLDYYASELVRVK